MSSLSTLPTYNVSHTLALGISVKFKSAHGTGHNPSVFLDTSPGYFTVPCHQRAKLCAVVTGFPSVCPVYMALEVLLNCKEQKHIHIDYHSHPVYTSCASVILFLFFLFQ